MVFFLFFFFFASSKQRKVAKASRRAESSRAAPRGFDGRRRRRSFAKSRKETESLFKNGTSSENTLAKGIREFLPGKIKMEDAGAHREYVTNAGDTPLTCHPSSPGSIYYEFQRMRPFILTMYTKRTSNFTNEQCLTSNNAFES